MILGPIFDVIWNASGVERCPNYDENGVYQYDETGRYLPDTGLNR